VTDQQPGGDGVTRLSFLKGSAGVAAGMAAVGVPAAAAITTKDARVVTTPASRTPREPVIAYVRDAARGEVTIVSGTSETTYRDRALAQRLLDAAPRDPFTNGGASVLAP